MAKGTKRSGKYVRQITGYRAFEPKPLPPNPRVRLSDEGLVLLSKADRALGRLDGTIHTLPYADLLVLMFVRKEAVLSSQIEGTQSSLQDVLAAEAEVLSPEQPKDVDEVLNYIAAMNYGLARLTTLPISVRLIREIHEKLLANVRGSHLTPGELRKTQNWIGPSGCTLADATFVPPAPETVGKHLTALEKFLHADSSLPLLVKIALIHAQFETIHPFLDGNGRVGRLLITFLLCHHEVLAKPVLYLSLFFKRHRQDYYDRLQCVRDDGAWEEWVEFFLRGVVETSHEASETARKVLALREAHRSLLTEKLGRSAGNGHRVLEHLYAHPIIGVADVQRLIDTSYNSANKLVARLETLGLLREMTGHARNRRYIYQPYTRLFFD